ncbi:MAG TPA: DUF72 domain-containing protein [Solirubrobacteraceae bacterium]|nr:DUF72 domain-containing protein [Solirubrobacteraceae bacterium]
MPSTSKASSEHGIASEQSALGARVEVGSGVVLCGTCSWTDKTLVQESDWYPRRTMSAEARLRFYAARFPVAEIDSTYYAPPAEQQARLWAERTPNGFRFEVKAYSLLTGHPTRPQSLWKDLREALPEDVRDKRSLYASHLPPGALDEAWRRFADALAPLHEMGRLGAVLFQYPPWFHPSREHRAELEALRARLPDYGVCVELRSPRWVASERDRQRTLALLRDTGLTYVCVDAPPVSELPRLLELTTPELFVMRLHGRANDTWKGRTRTAAERFRYLYSEDELEELANELAPVAESARESHLLMNNCYRDYGVRNAAQLRELLTP